MLNRKNFSHAPLATIFPLVFFWLISVHAETTNSTTSADKKSFSLVEVRRLAFERNWDLLAAKSGVDLATAQEMVARQLPNPTASFTTAEIGTHENATSLGNGLWQRSYDSIAAISQLIEIAGKRRDRRLSARAGITGARARFLDAKRTLDQGITKAYVAATLAEHRVHILNESAGYLLREAEIANARFKAGDLSDSDKKQIEIDAEQFELQAKAAEAAAVQARISVEVLMGISEPRGDWLPAEHLEQLAETSPATSSTFARTGGPRSAERSTYSGELTSGGLGKPLGGRRPDEGAFHGPENYRTNAARPDVLAAEADLKKSAADLKLQKAVRVPDPTISLQAEHFPQNGEPPADSVGFGISFPLPLWNRNEGNIKAAEANRAQAALALEKARAQAVSDIANAEVAYREAFERLQRYREGTGPKAAKVRETVAYAYEKGGASLVALLEAERTDNDVRLATAQAFADSADAAADLSAARTVLTESELAERHH